MKKFQSFIFILLMSFSANILAQNSFTVKEAHKNQAKEKVYLYPETKAKFPGGETEKFKFTQQHINYPQIAREIGLSGDVYISFIVEKDGSLSNLKIIKGIGSGCDEEVLKLFGQMNNWEAALENKEKVRSEVVERIRFLIQDNKQIERLLFPDVKAEYNGGNIALKEYFISHFDKLSKTHDYKNLNKVYFKFFVEKDGSTSNTSLLNFPYKSETPDNKKHFNQIKQLEKDFIAAFEKMPNWKPASADGENIKSEVVVAYDFSVYHSENNFKDSNDDSGEIANKEIGDEKQEKVYVYIEQIPEFPGGETALYKYIANNIVYPKEAQINNIQGTVYASFVVEKDGSISNIEILRGIGYGCDEEVIRVLSEMPDWTPGIQKGKAVRARYNIPVKFKLDKPRLFQRIKNIFKKK